MTMPLLKSKHPPQFAKLSEPLVVISFADEKADLHCNNGDEFLVAV